MECMIVTFFILIAAFEGIATHFSPPHSESQWVPGAFWKMNGSQLLDQSVSSPARQFQEVNGDVADIKVSLRSASIEDCSSGERNRYFEECQSVVEENFDANRIPQVISTVRCLQKGKDVFVRKLRCKNVKLQLPVLRKNLSAGERLGEFLITFETTSVACVGTVRPSRITSEIAHRVTFNEPS